MQTQLRQTESNVQSLEEEKAAWLSRGVQAEFEKKEEVIVNFITWNFLRHLKNI